MNKFHIELFSRGLYSSFCYHVPSRTLFDCGESASLHFGNFIYGIERIVFGHQHGDHVLGLASFIGIRNSGRGDTEKPLDIYYPKDNHSFQDLIVFINHRNRGLKFNINWIPIDNEYKIKIDDNHYIESFRMAHQKNALTLGYRICEKRSRLKSQYRGQNIPELIKNGIDKSTLNEDYIANTFAYTLDSYCVDPNDIKDAELAIIDCSFINPKDRDDMTHHTSEEAIKLVQDANVKNAVFAHISARYSHNDIKNFVQSFCDGSNIVVCPTDRVISI